MPERNSLEETPRLVTIYRALRRTTRDMGILDKRERRFYPTFNLQRPPSEASAIALRNAASEEIDLIRQQYFATLHNLESAQRELDLTNAKLKEMKDAYGEPPSR